MSLTNKQKVFVNEYLICWNATEAARRAGYAFPNVEGPKNLVHPSIKAVIDERVNEMTMTADEVLIRLGEQARGDLGDFLQFHPDINLPTINLTQAQDKSHLIKKLTYKNGQVSFELYDAQAALVHIGKHHGLFTDKVDITSKGEQIKFIFGGANIEDDI